jgi:hypothetical protein
VPVREKRRIEVNQVDALGRKLTKPVEVVVPVEDRRFEIADGGHERGYSLKSRQFLGLPSS